MARYVSLNLDPNPKTIALPSLQLSFSVLLNLTTTAHAKPLCIISLSLLIFSPAQFPRITRRKYLPRKKTKIQKVASVLLVYIRCFQWKWAHDVSCSQSSAKMITGPTRTCFPPPPSSIIRRVLPQEKRTQKKVQLIWFLSRAHTYMHEPEFIANLTLFILWI